jgi:hypothetical protein
MTLFPSVSVEWPIRNQQSFSGLTKKKKIKLSAKGCTSFLFSGRQNHP